jgi:histone arginine demethylase JMJD6
MMKSIVKSSTNAGICISKIHCENVSVAQFTKQFIIGSKPCLITGLTDTWAALKNWTEPHFTALYGDCQFACGNDIVTNTPITLSLSEYVGYCREFEHSIDNRMTNEENESCNRPLYLFDPTFESDCNGILADYEIPKYFEDDLLSVVDVDCRPNYRWLVAGPKLSGVGMHSDPLHTSAWNALIVGKKKWIMAEPSFASTTAQSCYQEQELWKLFSSVSTIRSSDDPIKLALQHVSAPAAISLPDGQEVILFTQDAGEVLFVPSGWQHAVINTEYSVAVTHNFLHPSTLLLSARTNEDSVSRVNESKLESVVQEWRTQISIDPSQLKSLLRNQLKLTAQPAGGRC